MITAFQTTSLVPHRFNDYLAAYARQGWAIERAVVGESAGSYFVEIGPQQRTKKFAAAPLVTRPPPVARLRRDARRACLSPGSGSGS